MSQIEAVQVLLVLILGLALKLREANLAASGAPRDPTAELFWTVLLIALNLTTVVLGFFLTLQGLPCLADWDTARESVYIYCCAPARWLSRCCCKKSCWAEFETCDAVTIEARGMRWVDMPRGGATQSAGSTARFAESFTPLQTPPRGVSAA